MTSISKQPRWSPDQWFAHLFVAGFTPIAPPQDTPDTTVQGAIGTLGTKRIACGAFDFTQRGGSLSVAAGTCLVAILQRGVALDGALIITASGGIRVQEGMLAMLQMPRLVATRALLAEARRPLVVIATDPTMGGVAGSIVATADIILAEPGARLALAAGRAGDALHMMPRVDTAETALATGLVDAVVARTDLPAALQRIFGVLSPA